MICFSIALATQKILLSRLVYLCLLFFMLSSLLIVNVIHVRKRIRLFNSSQVYHAIRYDENSCTWTKELTTSVLLRTCSSIIPSSMTFIAAVVGIPEHRTNAPREGSISYSTSLSTISFSYSLAFVRVDEHECAVISKTWIGRFHSMTNKHAL